jgi:large subunit ribosomal protein L35Ae
MKAIIVNFRGGRHTKASNQMVLNIEGVESKEKAEGLIGKQVSWTTPGKKVISGKISAAHGNSGAVRVHFEQGMPGQAIGKQVKVE